MQKIQYFPQQFQEIVLPIYAERQKNKSRLSLANCREEKIWKIQKLKLHNFPITKNCESGK